jgi:hypothetical protein
MACFSVGAQSSNVVSHTGVVECSSLPRCYTMANGKLSPVFCRIEACSSTFLLLHWVARSVTRSGWLLVIYRFLQMELAEIGHEIRLTVRNAPWRLLYPAVNCLTFSEQVQLVRSSAEVSSTMTSISSLISGKDEKFYPEICHDSMLPCLVPVLFTF